MRVALTREVSPAIGNCELTHLPRAPIDVAKACAEHLAYERALTDCGCAVTRVGGGSGDPGDDDLPDSVFIEDIALVFDEIAVVTRPGAPSRRRETAGVAEALRPHRSLRWIEEPGTMDGGDVLLVGRRVYVGRSARTNLAAIDALRNILAPFGYAVIDVEVTGCLHLKSAATAVGERLLVVNPRWVAPESFLDVECVEVHPGEPDSANALKIGDRVIYPSAFPRTRERLEARGVDLRLVDAGELAKAEGAVTCCSLIFDSD